MGGRSMRSSVGFFTLRHHPSGKIRWIVSFTLALFCLWNLVAWSCGESDHQQGIDQMETWSIAQMMAFLESDQAVNRTACRIFYEIGGTINPSNPWAYKDGQKSLCVDPGLAPKVNDCLVYSFGIDNEWSFDDEMAKLGCHVYAFDPSMEVEDHNHSAMVHFYQMGLWERDGLIVLDKSRADVPWKVLSLSSFHRRFGKIHGDRPVDYVKIDIEGDEWTVLPQIMASGVLDKVKQLALEIHFQPENPADLIRKRIRLLRSLETHHGFIPFDYKSNLACLDVLPSAKNLFGCGEIVFFNSKFRNPSGTYNLTVAGAAAKI